jgi:aldehyde:ferredoxin oxidoreductase
VYNFQRVFNLRMGFGTREHDYPPYRAVGPVTVDEYESRADFYDKQLARYEQLLDAVYARRGWDENGIPTLQTLRRLGIDLPEVISLVLRS